jgi:NAD(P)H-dependent flavin oxidoreductase YrpB (nitropropane dioxygenase family)
MGRPVLRTPLCDLLGIEYPIILAGMGAGNAGGAAGPELVAAVSEAGGLGVLGGTGHDVEEFHAACAEIRRLTQKPFGVDLLQPTFAREQRIPTSLAGTSAIAEVDPRYWDWVETTIEGLGLQRGEEASVTRDGPFTEPARAAAERQQRHIQAIISERPAVFAAGLGSPGPYVPALHQAGITVFGLVGNVKTARRVHADGVDIIVAQGTRPVATPAVSAPSPWCRRWWMRCACR